MCGIYGILQRSGQRFDPSVIHDMGRAQRHRGPDDSGFFADDELMFGMQRLAIIDVAGGHQPIANEDNTVTAICNGEIYNFRELRQALQAKGHKFRTGSDSEVIVHLYEEHGTDFVSHLSGMFALALWDSTRKRLLLARDRLGIKPLYIAANSGYLAFSSELKSILEIPGFERQIDPAALQEYLALGYVPAPLSMLKGIEKLPPGTLLVADQKGVSKHRYWHLADTEPTAEIGKRVDERHRRDAGICRGVADGQRCSPGRVPERRHRLECRGRLYGEKQRQTREDLLNRI